MSASAAKAAAPAPTFCSGRHHHARPSAKSTDAEMNNTWNAFNDIALAPDTIAHGPHRDEEQDDEKRDREQEHPEDQLLLGDQLHEIAGDQRSLDRRDHEGDRDRQVDRQVEVGDGDRDDGEHHQRHEYQDVRSNVLVDVQRVAVAHRLSSGSYVKYNMGKRKIQTRSTKCQNSPEFSTRLMKCSLSVF